MEVAQHLETRRAVIARDAPAGRHPIDAYLVAQVAKRQSSDSRPPCQYHSDPAQTEKARSTCKTMDKFRLF